MISESIFWEDADNFATFCSEILSIVKVTNCTTFSWFELTSPDCGQEWMMTDGGCEDGVRCHGSGSGNTAISSPLAGSEPGPDNGIIITQKETLSE